MNDHKKIALNFLPIEPQNFEFTVYRKLMINNEQRPCEDVFKSSLPNEKKNEPWPKYWVSFTQKEDYEEFLVNTKTNNYLTREYLFQQLVMNIKEHIPERLERNEEKFYKRRIFFKLEEFDIGKQVIWLDPFYLKKTSTFGFLIDFCFISNDDSSHSKERQKLSLNLDSSYRSNKNFHQEKLYKIKNFIDIFLEKLNPISDNTDLNLRISNKFSCINSSTLSNKIYSFDNMKTNNSQFQGIKEYGPYQKSNINIHYHFIFKEENIDLGRDLLRALNGETFKQTFPGMEKMFHIKLGKDNVSKIIINSYNKSEIDKAIESINKSGYENNIATFIFPEKDSDFYYNLKNVFLNSGVLTQGVHIETLKNTSGLKWSISSIALQLFSKSGGVPWRLKPSNENCLIIGIGKAHHLKKDNGRTLVEKYFAYSVLTDSSGKYVSMDVLSSEKDENNYLNSLQANLKKIVEDYKDKYQKITLHIPFKIQLRELDAIKKTIINIDSEKEFVVIKIDDQSKYFGYNIDVNSFVPYESTLLELSQNEYLLWTEGLNYHNKKVIKRYSNPLHIEFYYSNKNLLSQSEKNLYLQDIMNLSGASWRGFNAKKLPISMFYPKIISRFIKEFSTRNLTEINFQDLPPWFL